PSRNPPSEVSTSMAGHSRVQPSTMVNIRITLPVATQSLTKSIDQRSFGLVAAGLVTAPLQRIRRRCPNPHRPTFLAVEPVHALVVGRHSFPHQHRRQPPIPETHALRR